MLKYALSLLLPFLVTVQLAPQTLYNPLPRFLINPSDCPLNACEVVKIFAEHLFNARVLESGGIARSYFESEEDEDFPFSSESFFSVRHWQRQRKLESRIAEVERRLRSVEQPLWKVVEDSEEAWDRCTESVCRCQPSIKSLSCWRTGISVLPDLQVIPNSIIKM